MGCPKERIEVAAKFRRRTKTIWEGGKGGTEAKKKDIRTFEKKQKLLKVRFKFEGVTDKNEILNFQGNRVESFAKMEEKKRKDTLLEVARRGVGGG